MKLNEHDIALLKEIMRWHGAATSQELGGYSPLGARARTKCKRLGLVTYDGYFRITDAGRVALTSAYRKDEA